MSPSNSEPKLTLSRETILLTSVAYVDRYGLQALSMRSLGKLLGVEAMSLYHHVNGREDLLEGMIDQLVSNVRIPVMDEVGPVDGWQAFLQHVAHDMRRVAIEHPRLFPMVATRPPAAPWLRPPLRSIRLVDEFLAGLMGRGLSEDNAVYVYKAFTGFLLGHLLLEVAQMGAPTGPPSEPLDEGHADVPNSDQGQNVDAYPTLQRLKSRLQQHDAQAEFEMALESLLVRLDLELSQ